MRGYTVPERSRNHYLDKCFDNDEVSGKGGTRGRSFRIRCVGTDDREIDAEINAEMDAGS